MKCQFEMQFDDMYPEFAPDPITIVCSERATHHFTVVEDRVDDGGYPLEGQRETVHRFLCTEHACDEMANGGVADPMYHGVLIRTEVTLWKRVLCPVCGGDGWTDGSAELRRDGRTGDTTCIGCAGRGYNAVPERELVRERNDTGLLDAYGNDVQLFDTTPQEDTP